MRNVEKITFDIGESLSTTLLPNEPPVNFKSNTISSIITLATPAHIADWLEGQTFPNIF